MMAGRGGGQPAADGGLARHIPVLGGPAVDFLNVRDGGVYIDATFGAGGYTRADPRRRQLQRDRHRPRPARDRRAASTWCRAPTAGWCWSRIASPISKAWRAPAATTRSTASCSTSACRRCSSTRPRAASRSASTVRSTCAWAATGRAPPTWWRAPSERDLAVDHRDARRRAACPRRRPRHRARPRRDADRDHRRAGRHRRPRRACAPRHDPSGDAHVPGAAHLRQRGAARARRRAGGRRARAAPGRAAGRGLVPFARGSHRQIVPHRARPPQRRLAPRAGGGAGAARASASSPAGRSSPTKPRSPPIRARVRPSCAPPSAPTRRPALTLRTICCRGCRRSPRS